MKLGSLCTGVGGLDLAVEQFFDADLAWCAEIDPAASRVLAARFPAGVPNIGNFVGQRPEPVDILCGGFPCQPVSLAGKRAGTDDDRWLFDDICDLVGRMEPRPRWLVFENVRGLLSANDGDAMARVVHGLARLGYVGSWRVVRASDVGAPHRRERVFIVARNTYGGDERPIETVFEQSTDPGRVRADRLTAADANGSSSETHDRRSWPRDVGRSQLVGRGDTSTANTGGARTGRDSGAVPRTPAGARRLGTDVPATVDGGAAVADAASVCGDGERVFGHDRCSAGNEAVQGPVGGSGGVAADAAGAAWPGERRQRASEALHEPGEIERLGRCDRVDFGPFAPAVARWGRLLGRAAPQPVDDRRRLNPAFVEWMMGFSEGWVTDVLDRRTDALRCLGNAVVPQQAMHALSLLVPAPELCATR